MIIKFGFNNFKSIHHPVELSFEASASEDLEEYYVIRPTPKLRLLKMAAIYGANASGKSNVLEALDFLRRLVVDPALKKTDKIEYDRFAFDEKAIKGNSSFTIDFVQNGIRYDYSVVLNPECIVEETIYFYAPNKALLFKRETSKKSQLTRIEFGSKVSLTADRKRLLEANTLWNNTVLGAFLKVNVEFPELFTISQWFLSVLGLVVTPKTNLHRFITSRLRKEIINPANLTKILQKADFNISGLIIKPDKYSEEDYALTSFDQSDLGFRERELIGDSSVSRENVIFQHSIENKESSIENKHLKYEHQSLGTQRFYQFAGLLDLMIRQQKIFAIDEIESSLHPDLLKHFLLLFLRNSRNSQLIFTTHQREFMRETDMLRNDIFHFTEKGADGSTEIYSFTDFDSSVIRKGSSLYNAYKIGKLGATPELEDAYIPVD